MPKRGTLTAIEYRTIRQTLGFSQEEAAAFHKVQNVRTINRWESGKSFVSELACQKILKLYEKINSQIDKARTEINKYSAKDIEVVLIIYPEGCRNMICGWKDLPLSVHTAMTKRIYNEVKAAGGKIGLVTFDMQSYITFLSANGLKDCHESRCKWSNYVYNNR